MRQVNRVAGFFCFALALALAWSAAATTAEMYFSSDKNGQNRVSNIQEGDEIFIVVYDPDENIDCDVRDKIWTDLKIMDPKTGAYIVWISYDDDDLDANDHEYDNADYSPFKGHFPGDAGSLTYDYLEETGADTGLFASKRAFQVGTREDYGVARMNTHVVDDSQYPGMQWPHDFQWGHYLDPAGEERGWYDEHLVLTWGLMTWKSLDELLWPEEAITNPDPDDANYVIGRFENMDTLVGLYQDRNDETDVAVAMMKIIDTEATVTWDGEIYKDANGAATITVVDPDENLNCSKIEYVPVFILVNPGSWNPVKVNSPTSFCLLKATGGVYGGSLDGTTPGAVPDPLLPMRWFNMYHSQANAWGLSGAGDGLYYVEYPTEADNNVATFDTVNADGITAVSFYAQETSSDSGVFELRLNSLLTDLGFKSLNVRDVLVAYYLDPNDEDDFKLATAYIEERQHSITSFTDANRADQEIYWIGRDPVYVQVIDSNANVDPCCPEQVVVHICDPHGDDDSEWWILNETSSNSPVFFSFAGMALSPVWDALGIGYWGDGYNLALDNWRLEVFNEDDVYVRYNDQYYVAADLMLLGDVKPGIVDKDDGDVADLGGTAYPPTIDRVRVFNDVSFDTMSIADTQVYDGETIDMWFLDRNGNRVSGYVNSDCVFVEVLDPDQDEDQLRRERIDGFWDNGENVPFGPVAHDPFECNGDYSEAHHPVNSLLGFVNIFNDGPTDAPAQFDGQARLYVLNPRSGMWAAVDLLENGVATGDFVSVTCIDLVSVYADCVPTLSVLPGDTIVAVYQDPSNHSDSAWISVKVGIGGGGTTPGTGSTTTFVDANQMAVDSYAADELVYVLVTDPSQVQDTISGALVVGDVAVDLYAVSGSPGVFMTEAITLDLIPGTTLTAEYVDPFDGLDMSSDTITIIASELDVDRFYAAPNPFESDATFGYEGSGVASVMSVEVYDLAGGLVWAEELANVTEIVWDGTDEAGLLLANGGYIYVITATDGTNTFNGKGTVFINR